MRQNDERHSARVAFLCTTGVSALATLYLVSVVVSTMASHLGALRALATF